MAARRGVRFVITFLAIAVFISMAGLLLMYLLVGRGPSVPSSATLVLRPGGDLLEVVPDTVVGQFLGRDVKTVQGFVDTLRKAKRDPRIQSVLLMPSTLTLPYWGKVQELRDALVDFRASGKTVIAFLEYGGDREYYLASAADKVYLLPTSPLDLTGVASYEIFLRGTLDKIGAYPDFLAVGEFKTAVNQLTETGFTPEHREMAEAINRDMYAQLVAAIAESRGMSEDQVRSLIDRGPFTPEEALRLRLVDELAYEDQLDDREPALRDGTEEARRVEGADYERVSAASLGFRPAARIGVVYAVGTIVSGRSGYDPISGAVVGSETLVEQIRRARDDDSLDAIVLRIDSPGGSSIASDVVWRELMITRNQEPSRPLIASMSDLGASGGYYIAMPAHAIVAHRGTLTGSIGVFAGKIALGGTMEKLGVETATIKSGQNADLDSPFEPFSPEQRARLQDYMQGFYENFIEKAAEARNLTPEQIDAVARGRVWTGQQAREHGLVDALGGLSTAITIAKERAGIDPDEDVELVAYPARRSLYEVLTESLTVGGGDAWTLAGRAERQVLAALTTPARLFRRGEPLVLMPFAFVR